MSKIYTCTCCRSYYSFGQLVSKPGQFVSTWVSLFQPRSTGFKLDHFGASKNNGHMPHITGHCFTNTETYLFTDADIRPENFHLSLLG